MKMKAIPDWRRGFNLRLTVAFALFALCLLLNACSVGQHHTSDAKLERNFLDHEAEFETLLAEVQRDQKLTMIDAREAHYAGRVITAKDGLSQMERVGLTKERLEKYRRLLQDLGLSEIVRVQNGVEFRVDQGSLFNGDSYKGYEYSLNQAQHPKPSLDGYRISENDRGSSGGYYVSKPLKGYWRLYLYINA